MPKLVHKKKNNFTIIGNAIFKDKKLGISERGLLATMLSLPDSWNYSIDKLSYILPDGATKISNTLKKLEKAGYLRRERIYNNGKVVKMVYTFSDEKLENFDTEKLDEDNPALENQETDLSKSGFDSNYQSLSDKEHNNKVAMSEESIVQSTKADEMSDGFSEEAHKYKLIITENVCLEMLVFLLSLRNREGSDNRREAEEIIDMIVRAICSEAPTQKICGQTYSRQQVRETLLKADTDCIINAIDRMSGQESIKNRESYFISTLINEINGHTFNGNSLDRWADQDIKDYGI